MGKFAKSSLTVNGNSLHMAMPFSKVDVNKRTVSGYATLDNIDSQGDVVTAEASRAAFSRARGNLREMHEKIAVGRIIDFREDEYYDQETGQLYSGIYVTAYVSEGAESTWLKVLDNTLTGFSIGGEIKDSSTEFVKDANTTVRFIKDYDLVELSLVDNPANQLANVFSIQKVADGSVSVEGMVADTEIENVFFCTADETIIVKASEDAPCPTCGAKMENIGWFESGPDRTDKVRGLVSKFLTSSGTEDTPVSEGGVNMTKKDEEVKEETPTDEETQVTPDAVDATDEDAAEQADREPNEVVDEEDGADKAADVSEIEDEEDIIAKKIDELKETVHDALEKSRTETSTHIQQVEEKVNEISKSLEEKASEWESKFSEFGQKLEAAKSRLGEFEKALETMNKSAAVRKSADVESAGPVQKSKTFRWGTGTFSSDALFK